MLEGLQDPGNLGTLLRSAAACGLRRVFLSSSCASAWSPRVCRAAMGAHFHLDLYEDMAVLWSRKGDALLKLSRYDESRAAYGELMEINPFHVPGREGLLEIAEKKGDSALADSERKILELIAAGEEAVPPGHGLKRRER